MNFHFMICLVRTENFILVTQKKRLGPCLYFPPNFAEYRLGFAKTDYVVLRNILIIEVVIC